MSQEVYDQDEQAKEEAQATEEPKPKVWQKGSRMVGYFKEKHAPLLLQWLSTHENRLRIWMLGGKKLSLMIVYDREAELVIPSEEVARRVEIQHIAESVAKQMDAHKHFFETQVSSQN